MLNGTEGRNADAVVAKLRSFVTLSETSEINSLKGADIRCECPVLLFGLPKADRLLPADLGHDAAAKNRPH